MQFNEDFGCELASEKSLRQVSLETQSILYNIYELCNFQVLVVNPRRTTFLLLFTRKTN